MTSHDTTGPTCARLLASSALCILRSPRSVSRGPELTSLNLALVSRFGSWHQSQFGAIRSALTSDLGVGREVGYAVKEFIVLSPSFP